MILCGWLFFAAKSRMQISELLDELLPLSDPLKVQRVEKDEALREVHIYLEVDAMYQQLGVYAQRIANIYHYYTEKAYQSHSVSACSQVGINKTSTRKGHDYITAFVDLDTHQILSPEEGKGADTIEHFFPDHP